MKALLTLSLVSFLTLNTLYAQESFDDDLGGFGSEEVAIESDDLDFSGFEDDSSETEPIPPKQSQPSNLSLSGNLAFKTGFGYLEHTVDGVEYQGFNQAQTALYLQADYKFSSDWKMRVSGDAFYDAIYDLRDEPYNQDILDTYQTQLRLDDTYIHG